MNFKTLKEASAKQFTTKREELLKKQLIELLISKHHSKYAQRLSLFDIHIVPLKTDPNFTAAISFDDGVIFISEGFLQDPATFNQLDMLMRHELAHNLMMHQVRMMHKIGEDIYPELGTSYSIHELLNIIEDFEISNTRYSDEDKEIVRHTWLNGKEISGLVTEDLRPEWQDLSLEEMYDRLTEELEEIRELIISHRIQPKKDFLFMSALQAFNYTMSFASPSRLMCDPGKFINNRGSIYLGGDSVARLSDLPQPFQKVVKAVYEIVTDPESLYSDQEELLKVADEIVRSHPTTPYLLESKDKDGKINKSKTKINIISPEEKWLALELIKALVGYTATSNNTSPSTTVHVKKTSHSQEYRDIYNKIIDALGSRDKCSDSELSEIMSNLDLDISEEDLQKATAEIKKANQQIKETEEGID